MAASGARFAYYLGLDLGQAQDYTALAIVEEPVWDGARWLSPAGMSREILAHLHERVLREGRPANPVLSVRHLERFELGTRYTEVVERIRELVYTPPLAGKSSCLLVDKTGVGAAVLDAFEHSGVRPGAITIHGGSTLSFDPHRRGYRVPKRDLVSAVQVLLQTRRLRVAEGLAEAATLKRELLNFRVKVNPATAHDSYEHWREGDHDDLVLATAMPCWYREMRYARAEARYAKEQRNRPKAPW
jgi:hypothetical protein